MVEKTVLHNLPSGMVLDRSSLVVLGSTDIQKWVDVIRAAGDKDLLVVPSAEHFFKPNVLIEMIGQKNPRFKLVNEGLGGFFTEPQIAALMGANHAIGHQAAIQHAGMDQHNGDEIVVNVGADPAPEGYVFAVPPQGWSVGGNMSLGPTKIKRKVKNPEGDGTLFFMHPNDFEKLWMAALKAWSGVDAPIQVKVMTGLGACIATIQDDRITLKGNYIRRYEIEQVAKYRGWAMPNAVVMAA